MAVSIDENNAEILARLSLDDIRGYAKKYPEACAEYLAKKHTNRQQAKQRTITPSSQGVQTP